MTESTAAAIALPARRAVAGSVLRLAPVVILWAVLVGWLAALLYDRASWSEESDAAAVREWVDEARNFRKTLPELVKEFVAAREDDPSGTADRRRLDGKRDEIAEHMRSLAEPTRTYVNQLPLFPEIYRLEVRFAGPAGDPIGWVSSVPRPARGQIRELRYRPLGDADDRAEIRVEYRLHAFNKLQRREDERQETSILAGVLLVTATLLTGLFVYRVLARERRREVDRLTAAAELEHHERELLQSRLKQEETDKARQELNARLAQKQFEAADLQRRAAEAEKATLEMKSQLYASIGIMAGSYAHNIKNLLVRPNDLLVRCIEANGLSGEQEGMLHEVKSTLGTVTERLQQILRTVRRDPGQAEVTRLDLNAMAADTARCWTDTGRDKWKLRVSAELAAGPLWITGDVSHLQQAIENLLFNARDATFEMRNHQREEARRAGGDAAARKQRLIDAAAWKGEVTLATRAEAGGAVLEVRDNGIGMTDEVRRNCLRTHFTTKRDNALYEGYTAGMGLGLSFVAMVLEHHEATLEIESGPLRGAVFRIRFPAAAGEPTG